MKRVFLLLQTSFHILAHQGLRAFISRVWHWLAGDRTNFSTTPYTPIHLPLEVLEHQRNEPARLRFAMVTALYQPPDDVWKQTIQSVLEQTYDNWKWYVVDASNEQRSAAILLSWSDDRIEYIRLEENKGISHNTNIALKRVTEEWVVMLDHDDMLAPHALYTLYKVLNDHPEADVLYSDYDKIAADGRLVQPFYKFNWSPDTLLCANIVTHLTVFRHRLLEQTGYLNPALDGSQDWDLYLRISEISNHFIHIPEILYHWRMVKGSVAQSIDNKPYVRDAQMQVVRNHLLRQGFSNVSVYFDPHHPLRKIYPYVSWNSSLRELSIIIEVDYLLNLNDLLQWLRQQTVHQTVEFILLVQTQHMSLLDADSLLKDMCRLQHHQGAYLDAVASARYERVLFISSRLRILSGELQRVSQWFDKSGIGVAGIKIVDNRQHILHAGMKGDDDGVYRSYWAGKRHLLWTAEGTDCWYRDVPAVDRTFAMLRRDMFMQAVKLSEHESAIDWFDLCMKFQQLNFRILYTPDIVAVDLFS